MSSLIVESGVWLYADSVEKSVEIISHDYDWWYESAKADNKLELQDKPQSLNEMGLLYYVYFERLYDQPIGPATRGTKTVAEAKKIAESIAPSEIVWSKKTKVIQTYTDFPELKPSDNSKAKEKSNKTRTSSKNSQITAPSKMTLAKSIFEQGQKDCLSRKEIIQRFETEAGLTTNGVSTYYQKIKYNYPVA